MKYTVERLGTLGIRILLTLYSSKSPGRKYIRELVRDAGTSRSAIYYALKALEEYGLIIYEKMYGRKFAVLTPLGWKVAERLNEANEILERERGERREEKDKEGS